MSRPVDSAALVERVAEAIYESDRYVQGAAINAGRHNGAPWERLSEGERSIYRRNAEAAVETIRVEAQVDAWLDVLDRME